MIGRGWVDRFRSWRERRARQELAARRIRNEHREMVRYAQGVQAVGGGWAPAFREATIGFVERLILPPGQLEQRNLERRAITSVPWNPQNPWTVGAAGGASPERALRLAPVYGAVRILASSLSSLPLHAYRETGDSKVRLPSLPSLFQKPSAVPLSTIVDWLFRLMASLALTGNAWGLVLARDGFGYPTTIEWLSPNGMEVRGSAVRPEYWQNGKQLPTADVVHIPWFVLPGEVRGLSPIGAYAASIDSGMAALVYSRDWYAAGGFPPGTFKNTAKIVPREEAEEVKARLVRSIQSHQPIVYGADWDYNAISIPPGEAAFVETMKLTATQIAVIYGLDPTYLGGDVGGKSLTYSNVEQRQLELVTMTLLPWVTKLEAVFAMLLPERQYVKFNMDALIRPDTKGRHEIYQIDRTIGLRSTNEIRELEDLPPIPGPAGSSYDPLAVVVAKGQPKPVAPVVHQTLPAPNQPAPNPNQPPPGGPNGGPKNGKVPAGRSLDEADAELWGEDPD